MKKSTIILLVLLMFVISTECEDNESSSDVKILCGVQKIAKNNVIVGGQDAPPGFWPWQGAIYHRNNGSDDFKCGGTLVGLTFVLTAKHCVSNSRGEVLSNARIFVRFGIHDLTEVNATTLQDRNVLKIHLFEDADPSRNNLTNDIALLELSNRVQLNNYTHPACISQEENLVGQHGMVAGWGFTESDKISNRLKIASMPVIRTMQCLTSNRDFFGTFLDDSLICVGYTNGTTVCNGDSGGGLLFQRGDQWFVGGVVAFTALRENSVNLCSREGYATFTKVFYFKSWIGNVMGLENLTGETKILRRGVAVDPIKKYPDYLPRNCGSQMINRILNGQKARLFEYPWMVILIYPKDGWFGAGTIISKRYVLTTVSGVIHPTPYKVRLGEYNRDQVVDCDINDEDECAPPVQDYHIEYIVCHQNYKPSKLTKPNDIALIRLKHEVIFEDHIQPICLPVTRTLQQMHLSEYIISGWGHTEIFGEYSSILLKARVPLVERVECESSFSNIRRFEGFTETHVCAGRNDTADTCAGDGGGPLGFAVQNRGVRFVQFGITSYGHHCGLGPTVYTNVSYHMPWIRANMDP